MNQFNSSFAQNIRDMLAYKEALGYSSSSYEYYLLKFDEYCCANYPKETILIKEIVFDWAVAKKGESINSLNRRLAAIFDAYVFQFVYSQYMDIFLWNSQYRK